MKLKHDPLKTTTALLLLFAIISCSPSRDLQEGVRLKPGTISENHFSPCSKVISIERTMLGFKHTFVSPKNDTMIHFFHFRLHKDSCYRVAASKAKNLKL